MRRLAVLGTVGVAGSVVVNDIANTVQASVSDQANVTANGAVAVVGIGALVLGVLLMTLRRVVSPGFFHGLTLPRCTSENPVPAPAPAAGHTG